MAESKKKKPASAQNKSAGGKGTSGTSRSTRKLPEMQEKKRRAQVTTPHPEEAGGIPREAWAAIYGVLGVLCLIAILKNDGVVLRLIHTALGGLFGWGLYLCPPVLFGLCALLLARRRR